jgi:superfamily II DNA or RNA helicase/HKD family nuclease
VSIKLLPGLYESLVNEFIEKGVTAASQENLQAVLRGLDAGDSHDYFAQYLASHIRRAFKSLPLTERLEKQVELANKILVLLANGAPDSFDPQQSKVLRAELLLALSLAPIQRADTPLSTSCLMTGTRQDPSLVSQLRKEIATADAVDILCSFIKWGGVRILEDSLTQLTAAKSMRVITTSYMGATDLRAVDFLRSLPNTALRVSYDTHRTRLHAKAYIIRRDTGFGVAYIGSSNLSQSALTDGLEWNVKISQYESPHLWEKVCATFDTYWNDDEFVLYTEGSRDRLREALQNERSSADSNTILSFFDVKPYPFQQEILDRLEAERKLHGRFRNLVVAATGTGKTVISAFDYLRFKKEQEGRPARLLFIAHREEILKQSLATFQTVLRDHNFGDLLVAVSEPEKLDHLFVSIQSFNSRELWKQVPADFFDYVCIDEFHHAAAPSYQRLLEFVKPKILLGLTATPERMDALDVVAFFDDHIAAEIRLPDAINRKLLCPFQYFGISDSVDFSQIRWQRGGYDVQQLENLVTGNEVRAELIIGKVREILLKVSSARGLGFCVSVDHAEYMASVFNRAGISAVALSSNSSRDLRHSVQQKLVNREINFIFVVDLYNEGVDIPEIDTILLLRPTESLTVFLQQLGRGLRLHDEKECLTILDFIGQAHQNFSFESRFRALLGQTMKRVDEEIEQGFPHLPAGCVVALERYATRYILDNIRQATTQNRRRLIRRIASYKDETGREISLAAFLEYHRLSLDSVYRRGTWSQLLAEAGLRPMFSEPDEERLAKGLRRVAHINAARQLETLLKYLSPSSGTVFPEPENEEGRRFMLMLHFSLWARKDLPPTLAEGMERLRGNPTLLGDLRELLRLKLELLDEVPIEPTLPFLCPLQVHTDYTRDEILAGLGIWSEGSQREVREGVFHAASLPADILFVTLNKTVEEYSPTTMYDDYAISEKLFHWQSQSTTPDSSPTGKRYINHVVRFHAILLFVREDSSRDGLTVPYTFLGPVDYVNHQGSRPMSIIWRLRHKLPAKLVRNIRRLAND